MRPPQVRASSFLQSLLNLLNKHAPFRAFGRHNDVLAHPVYQASYPVSVRQYRSLPVGFLHCIPRGKPACHLLTVRGVTPARKGLSPSGNILCITLPFNTENLYFQHFFRASGKVCTCSCWAHTNCKLHCGVPGVSFAGFSQHRSVLPDRNELRNPQRQLTSDR